MSVLRKYSVVVVSCVPIAVNDTAAAMPGLDDERRDGTLQVLDGNRQRCAVREDHEVVTMAVHDAHPAAPPSAATVRRRCRRSRTRRWHRRPASWWKTFFSMELHTTPHTHRRIRGSRRNWPEQAKR